MATKSKKYVYHFGDGKADGNGTMKALLGGKGANLAEMSRLGFRVPQGFTITTEVCTYYYQHKKTYPKGLFEKDTKLAVAKLEKAQGKKFGDPKNPLLVSVRSGARESMPGMMDTILNLGLNDVTVEGLKQKTGNGRFAYDSYRRFVQMYGDVVMGVQKRHENEHEPFEEVMDNLKRDVGRHEDTALTEDDLKELIRRYRALIKERTGKEFPQNPYDQLKGAVGAVFGSWMTERAVIYRKKYKIPEEWGTAVNVQCMVFGNMGDTSGTGVAFTRNPATGANEFYGEYLQNAQGEDVVAGTRTPLKISDMASDPIFSDTHKELLKVRAKLEKCFGDVQDFEFTIEEKKLYMLQTRNGKRTTQAYVKIAHDMVKSKLMTPERAILSGDAQALDQLLAPIFDRDDEEAAKRDNFLTVGLPAGPGAAAGMIAFTAEKAERLAAEGKKVVLCRIETTPEDLRGMIAADGILTARGGVSSHAALVSRQMGKVCVAGAGEIAIDYHNGTLSCKGRVLREGDWIAINGSTGNVYGRGIKTADSELIQVLVARTLDPKESEIFKAYDFIMKLADKYRTMKIRTNADTPDQATTAIAFGAEGIGLTRTEHMFFEGDRIDAVREMILADTTEGRRNALAKLLPVQRGDFEGIFKAMGGRPVTIRLLDPPLHEFVPHEWDQMVELGQKIGVSPEKIKARVEQLKEFNPMLGHRGCRLGITYPEIYEMQIRAILEAACNVKKQGMKVVPEIMHPLIGTVREYEICEEMTHRIAAEVQKEKGVKVQYLVGTMIEIPRACVVADKIAEKAEFFSFGTNDLTQMAYGYSRDDAGVFIQPYIEEKILPQNPFATIDEEGVGQLMAMGVERGRKSRKDLKIGICGEHGGDPDSVKFCHRIGMNYVSCSPYRVPIARLSAAQAAILAKKKK
jgi:pyruvate,orthophosphate dikinase